MTPSTAAQMRPLPTGAFAVRPEPSVAVSFVTAIATLLHAHLLATGTGLGLFLTILGVVGAPIATGCMTIVVQLVLGKMRASPGGAAASPPAASADELAQLRRRLATLERENARLRGSKRR